MSDLIKGKRDVKNFTSIKIKAIANVEISQSDKESVIIEALPSSINKIKTESKEMDTKIFGAGSLFLSGSTDQESVIISGAGKIARI